MTIFYNYSNMVQFQFQLHSTASNQIPDLLPNLIKVVLGTMGWGPSPSSIESPKHDDFF